MEEPHIIRIAQYPVKGGAAHYPTQGTIVPVDHRGLQGNRIMAVVDVSKEDNPIVTQRSQEGKPLARLRITPRGSQYGIEYPYMAVLATDLVNPLQADGEDVVCTHFGKRLQARLMPHDTCEFDLLSEMLGGKHGQYRFAILRDGEPARQAKGRDLNFVDSGQVHVLFLSELVTLGLSLGIGRDDIVSQFALAARFRPDLIIEDLYYGWEVVEVDKSDPSQRKPPLVMTNRSGLLLRHHKSTERCAQVNIPVPGDEIHLTDNAAKPLGTLARYWPRLAGSSRNAPVFGDYYSVVTPGSVQFANTMTFQYSD